MKSVFYVCVCLFLVSACDYKPTSARRESEKAFIPKKYPANARKVAGQIHEKLAHLHQKMEKPQAGDWLEAHPEAGQTFEQYIQDTYIPLQTNRKWLIILPIGTFSPKQKQILDKTIRYMEFFYQLRSHTLPALSEKEIPKRAKRENGIDFQLHTRYVLDDLLLPQMRDTIACMLAFTAIDLYPAPSWRFVFGQASLVDRVGVWSMNRFGDPEKNREAYQTCLMHTIKTAIHEAGHIFGIKHCTAYSCCMSGSNNLEESARRTVTFCPICTAKVRAHFGLSLHRQHQDLARFWRENDFPIEVRYYEEAGKVLESVKLE